MKKPHLTTKIQIWQSANNVRDFVRFKDSLFSATCGGLAQFDETGQPEEHSSVLDGFPESDLSALAVFQNKLFIGTRTKHLFNFDGASNAKFYAFASGADANQNLFETLSEKTRGAFDAARETEDISSKLKIFST